MKRKIDVRDLEKGMYVSELDRPWVETPFLFQGFEIKDDNDIEALCKECSYTYIDTDLGRDIDPSKASRESLDRFHAIEEKEKELKHQFRKLAEMPSEDPGKSYQAYQDKTSLEEELVEARNIEAASRETMREAVEEAHKGNNVDMPTVKKVVNNMVDSIMRNPDALVCLSQLRDANEYSALHSIRTAILTLAFGRHLVLAKDELNDLGIAAMLHDIGMSRVPKDILDKPYGLDRDDFDIMTNHVYDSRDIIQNSGNISSTAMEYVLQHHERHDGSGYPIKLTHENIAPMGSVGAIVDVYDAITSDTAYHSGLSAEDVLKRMYEWRHKDFDGPLVEEFIKCMGIFPIGSLVQLNAGGYGVVITINRARRLKPKVAMVLHPNLKPYSIKAVADLSTHKTTAGEEIKIKRVLPAGTHDINPMDHIVQL